MSPLREEIAVVTGTSSGIGRAIALRLASHGASLCLVGRNSEALGEVARLARETAPVVLTHQADLTVDGVIPALAEDLRQHFGGIDLLVHCAGAFSMGQLQTTPVEELDRLYRANVRVPYLLTQCLLPLLKARQGQIVFINSTQGLEAKLNVGQFASTQHALKAIADSLREEINSDGVRVLSVYPGRTATPRMESIFKMEGREYRPQLLLQPEEIANVVVNAVMLPRTAEVTNISIRPLLKSY